MRAGIMADTSSLVAVVVVVAVVMMVMVMRMAAVVVEEEATATALGVLTVVTTTCLRTQWQQHPLVASPIFGTMATAALACSPCIPLALVPMAKTTTSGTVVRVRDSE